jgi:L-threonylcarbamoyladenylate synthase
MSQIIVQDLAEANIQAQTLLHSGQAIAFATDTVYGVGALAANPKAILRLFAVKRRPFDRAIPLLIADLADLEQVASSIPPRARILAQLWPGALTLVVPAAAHIAPELTGGRDTVAVRIPNQPWLRDLIRAVGPLATTSANLHGQSDPQTADQVAAQLGDVLPLIIDGGATAGPVPSTIVDCTGEQLRILRQGAIPRAQLEQLVGEQFAE